MRVARTIEGKNQSAAVYCEHIGKQWADRQVYWRMREIATRWWANVNEFLETKFQNEVHFVFSRSPISEIQIK